MWVLWPSISICSCFIIRDHHIFFSDSLRSLSSICGFVPHAFMYVVGKNFLDFHVDVGMSSTLAVNLLAWYFIRIHYNVTARPAEFSTDLALLIMDSANKVFESKILSYQQDLQLMQLLATNICITSCKCLYKASENEYLASTFHQACDELMIDHQHS